MEQPKSCTLDITWKEMVAVARELYDVHGDNLDIHELLLAELTGPQSPNRQPPIPRIVRRNTNEKISDGFKSVRDKLLGIRKISSSP